MKVVIQRVSKAQVTVNHRVVSSIESGLLLLVGIGRDDTESETIHVAQKIVNLRIFSDEKGKMNRSILEVGGEILAVPQFTLFAELKGQNRPYFGEAAKPDQAEAIFHHFVKLLENSGVKKVATGKFGAYMQVELNNDGPVTIFLDSDII